MSKKQALRKAAAVVTLVAGMFGGLSTAAKAEGPLEIFDCNNSSFNVERDAQNELLQVCFRAQGLARVNLTLAFTLIPVAPTDAGDLDTTTRFVEFTPTSNDERGALPLTVITPDVSPEPNQPVDIRIDGVASNPGNQVTNAATLRGQVVRVKIVDNDPIARIQSSVVIPEFDDIPSNMPVLVSLDKAPRNKTVCVNVRTGAANNGGAEATPGADFVQYPTSGAVKCLSGTATSTTYTVTVQPDRILEQTEFFRLTLASASAGLQVDPASSVAIVRILDN